MHNFDGRKIPITGGLGFIGSNPVRKLVERGTDATLVDSLISQYGGNLANVEVLRDKTQVNISDVRDPHTMSDLTKDGDDLFNLVAQTSHMDSLTDPFTDLEINPTSQPSILVATRKHTPRVRIAYTSTRQIYGKPQYTKTPIISWRKAVSNSQKIRGN